MIDWITELSPQSAGRARFLEQELRRFLAAIPEGQWLPTKALTERMWPKPGMHQPTPAEAAARQYLYSGVTKLARELGLNTRSQPESGTGRFTGKTINRYHWTHLPLAEVPQRPLSQSQGAAGPASSLVDRVQKLEDWAAGRDPLFRVL